MTLKKFIHYMENFELGKVNLPTEIELDIYELYKALKGYITNISDIKALIIFGSSILYPNYKIEVKYRKKYLLFGKIIKKKIKEKIYPNDLDFLIITKKPYFNKKFIKETTEDYTTGSLYYSVIISGKIDLINRSISQVKKSLKNKETVCFNALKFGLPIIDSGIIETFGIVNECPYKLFINDNNLEFNIDIR
jgi:hypothetical protein